MLTKITAQYRWFEGATFDHAYYATKHMAITLDAVKGFGHVRLESEQVQWPQGEKSGQVVAATSVYFPDMSSARTALAAAGDALRMDLVNYTNIRPEMRIAQVSSHQPASWQFGPAG
ncbi:EthD family reductase [Hydrogenophaga sp.]|uniref:EthD family reductase n=1 Tax=Hydrogenophaga sp. TaxID=1904254 RepID=UPI003D0F5D22